MDSFIYYTIYQSYLLIKKKVINYILGLFLFSNIPLYKIIFIKIDDHLRYMKIISIIIDKSIDLSKQNKIKNVSVVI
jgi:hypothetical protein